MPRIDQRGPEGKGPLTGRRLGLCSGGPGEDLFLSGQGMGKRRKMGGGQGLGKRLQYDQKGGK